jgi:MFS family permease
VSTDTGYTPAQRWWFLSILFLVASCNYLDRYVIAVLLEPIKREFGASDTLLGLLSGASFAVLYAVMGIPFARWADRGNRKHIITLALTFWSLMTALCGAAQTFWQLALARVGVGVGEAGSMPASQSLLVDYFPAHQRARVLAIFTSAGTVGYLLAFIGGSHLVAQYGWRRTLFAVAVPGLLIAMFTMWGLKEPRVALKSQFAAARAGQGPESVTATLLVLWHKRSFRYSAIALTLWAFFAYGALLFVPSHLMRAMNVDLKAVGTAYGGVSAVAALIGTLGGGWLTDRLARLDRRWLLRVPAWSMVAATPLYVAAFMVQDFWLFLSIGAVAGCLMSATLPAFFTAAHAVCGAGRRAMAVAVLLFFMSLIGAGLGPVVTGVVSDLLRPQLGAQALGYALSLMSLSMLFVAVLAFMASRHLESDAEA